MPEDLWKIRQRKKMSVADLSAKSGVPALSIQEYELGQVAIRAADLPKLAKALYVEEWDIKLLSEPIPTSRPRRPSRPRPSASPPRARKEKGSKKERRPPGPITEGQKVYLDRLLTKLDLSREDFEAKLGRSVESLTQEEAREQLKLLQEQVRERNQRARETQIAHILELGKKLEMDRPALEAEAGKALTELSRREASRLLRDLQERLTAKQAATPKRKRAHLPEAVDEFEFNYLARQQEEGATLVFTLFDGSVFSGQIVGFSPYSITIREPGGDEVTLQKLAIAYYRRATGQGGE